MIPFLSLRNNRTRSAGDNPHTLQYPSCPIAQIRRDKHGPKKLSLLHGYVVIISARPCFSFFLARSSWGKGRSLWACPRAQPFRGPWDKYRSQCRRAWLCRETNVPKFSLFPPCRLQAPSSDRQCGNRLGAGTAATMHPGTFVSRDVHRRFVHG